MQNSLKKYLITILIAILGISCVDLYDPNLKNVKTRLVIEGLITTQLDYHWVDLSLDAGYNSKENNFLPFVKNAKVWITDDAGNRYDFTDDRRLLIPINASVGFDYRSLTKFQAVVGRTYQLHVQTEDGKMYRSKPEFVRAVPKLDKIYTEFNRIPIGSGANVIGEFSVYVDLKDSSTTKDFYRWESIHWEQLKYCEHYSVIAELPAKIYGQPCCETCYEFSVCKECKPTQSDRLMNGNTIKKLIAKIPYDTLSPYFLNIKQFSISESTFLYLNSIENQAQNTGGLFDVTPKQVRGNISNINDAEEEVLGYFSATDLVEKTIYFERNIPNFRPFPRFKPIEVLLCYPCIERYRRTKSPPKNWIK